MMMGQKRANSCGSNNETSTSPTSANTNVDEEDKAYLFEIRAKVQGPAADPKAIFLLATIYSEGLRGRTVNHSRAFNLYFQGAKFNHPDCAYRTAVSYEHGVGIKCDMMGAVQCYKKAASLGHPLAIFRLARILLFGELGQIKDLKKGITWLKRAATQTDQVNPEAIYVLGQCYERNGGCPVVLPDEPFALEQYKLAASLGYAPAQHRLGSCSELGQLGCIVDPSESIMWYSKAAAQSHAPSELALARWYQNGYPGVLPQSDEEAFQWATKAAEHSFPPAQFLLAGMYENGLGVGHDAYSAINWYRQAAKGGYERAVPKISELSRLIGHVGRLRHSRQSLLHRIIAKGIGRLHNGQNIESCSVLKL